MWDSQVHLLQVLQLLFSRRAAKGELMEPVQLFVVQSAILILINNVHDAIECPHSFAAKALSHMVVQRQDWVDTGIARMLKHLHGAVWIPCRALIVANQVYSPI